MNFTTVHEKTELQWKIALIACFLIGLLVGIVINTELHIIEIPKAYSLGVTDPECYEIGDYSDAGGCPLFSKPLEVMVEPFKVAFGGFAFVVIWGIIMGVLWLRVQNTMMVGVVGVLLASVFTAGFSPETKIIGYGLLAVAIAVALYQILTVRVHYPQG
jgi:prepilin signal peptidase PulO-like enzyme (type II secretory pathway)